MQRMARFSGAGQRARRIWFEDAQASATQCISKLPRYKFALHILRMMKIGRMRIGVARADLPRQKLQAARLQNPARRERAFKPTSAISFAPRETSAPLPIAQFAPGSALAHSDPSS